MLLHNVDSTTTALPNGACTYRCISKQMHYITHFFTQRLQEMSGILWKLHHSVLSGKKLFSQNHAWSITQSGWNNYSFGISCNQGTSPFCTELCLRMHTNVMLRFMVQALQDPPLCSSTSCTFIENHFLYIKLIIMRCCSSPSPFRAESFYLIGLLKAPRQCKIILWVHFSRVLYIESI